MGLFNTILLNRKCPHCGHEVWWQTKSLVIDDIYPVENVVGRFEVNERMDAETYACCGKCGRFTDLEIKKGEVVEKSVKCRKPRKFKW